MVFFTFLRHGRSQADDEHKFESRYDTDLSEIGRSQIQKLVEEWRSQESRRYDVIVTSPLKRARSTADILSALYKVPIVQHEYLNELDAGALCGMEKDEGLRKHPPPKFTSPYHRIVDGTGESEAKLHARALLAVEHLINMKKTGYLVISHGMILNAIVRCIIGAPMPIDKSGVRFAFKDSSYADLIYDESCYSWTMLRFVNLIYGCNGMIMCNTCHITNRWR
jgi:2,3-bisphosphoglycerate-dependent phosphoglycerate mutase